MCGSAGDLRTKCEHLRQRNSSHQHAGQASDRLVAIDGHFLTPSALAARKLNVTAHRGGDCRQVTASSSFADIEITKLCWLPVT